jgi:RNA polymerase sigma factor (sigma-70 family)
MDDDRKDGDLLKSYATERSERAYRALVARHLDMVYSTALRQVGDHMLAEEIAQNVFLVLAREPERFRHECTLAGWLYKTALFQARQTVRSELRRKHREENAARLSDPVASSSVWEPLAPLLDEALMGLREKDRVAIVLRFFQEKSLRDVGQALGISEDAAQKRISKSLETLTRFFRRRGFTVPALTATTPVLVSATQAAPATVLSAVTHGALRKAALAPLSGGALALLKLVTMTKTQTALVCALIGAIPIAVQWHAADRARTDYNRAVAELDSLTTQLKATEDQLARVPEQRARAESSLVTVQQEALRRTAIVRTVVESEYYPWSEDSDYIRIPKTLLSRLAFRAMTFTNQSLALSDDLAAVFRLDSGAAERIDRKIADTEHRFRLMQANHSELIYNHVESRSPREGSPVEIVSFLVHPFPDEGAALRAELNAAVLAEVGQERFDVFMNHAPLYFGPRFVGFGSHTQSVMRTTFELHLKPEPKIQAFRSINSGRQFSGGGVPCTPFDDQYAPVAMSPVLARWRNLVEQGQSTFSGDPNR